MNKQYQIIVKGKVQRVGFRDKVEDIALDYDLGGYVRNLNSRDVFILAEGTEENLNLFCEAIQQFTLPIKVKSIQISEHPIEGTYSEFCIVRGDTAEEFSERFDSALYYLDSINTKLCLKLE